MRFDLAVSVIVGTFIGRFVYDAIRYFGKTHEPHNRDEERKH